MAKVKQNIKVKVRWKNNKKEYYHLYNKKWYKIKKNRERSKRWSKNYRTKNKNKIKKRMEKYARQPEVKKRSRDGMRKWRKLHLLKSRRNVLKYKRTLKGRYTSAKQTAKRRGIHFSLTYEQFLKFVKMPCFYCGNFPPLVNTGTWLDRLNSNKKIGYRMGNVVPCCRDCNVMKMDLSFQKFKKKLIQIVKHLELI